MYHWVIHAGKSSNEGPLHQLNNCFPVCAHRSSQEGCYCFWPVDLALVPPLLLCSNTLATRNSGEGRFVWLTLLGSGPLFKDVKVGTQSIVPIVTEKGISLSSPGPSLGNGVDHSGQDLPTPR